jgi:uncharacterized protein GlcG (DUF336 family)
MKTILRLETREAECMAAAALQKAAELKVPETVCIADDGGFPIVLKRMDGGRITGPQIAWNKAFTAAGHKRSTHLFNQAPTARPCPATRPMASSSASRAVSRPLSAATRWWWTAR